MEQNTKKNEKDEGQRDPKRTSPVLMILLFVAAGTCIYHIVSGVEQTSFRSMPVQIVYVTAALLVIECVISLVRAFRERRNKK